MPKLPGKPLRPRPEPEPHIGLKSTFAKFGTSPAAGCWPDVMTKEKRMTKMKQFAAAAVLSTVIASPVLAQDSMYRRSSVTQQYNYSDDGYRDRGFWPGDVATGIVGGAIGTAGAMASAPFQTSYDARDSYARANGFVCQPGTWSAVRTDAGLSVSSRLTI
jgi:hypothetical protein